METSPKPRPLTPQAEESYAENGYLVLPGLLSSERVDRLVAAADAAADGHYSNYLHFHREVPEFEELIVDPEILGIADGIQSHRMIPIGSIFFFCAPNNPLEQGSVWHQDNFAPRAPVGSYLVFAFALDDADAENGALQVVPRSHQLGELPRIPSKNFEFDEDGNVTRAYPIGDPVEIPEGYEPLQLEYRKGDAFLLHGHVIHGAQKNTDSTRWRRTFYMHLIRDGDPFWPGWNARRALVDRP